MHYFQLLNGTVKESNFHCLTESYKLFRWTTYREPQWWSRTNDGHKGVTSRVLLSPSRGSNPETCKWCDLGQIPSCASGCHRWALSWWCDVMWCGVVWCDVMWCDDETKFLLMNLLKIDFVFTLKLSRIYSMLTRFISSYFVTCLHYSLCLFTNFNPSMEK